MLTCVVRVPACCALVDPAARDRNTGGGRVSSVGAAHTPVVAMMNGRGGQNQMDACAIVDVVPNQWSIGGVEIGNRRLAYTLLTVNKCCTLVHTTYYN